VRSPIFDVLDTFDIEDRGVVVLGHVPYAWLTDPTITLNADESLMFVLPDGSELPATVRGVDFMRAPIGTPYGETPENIAMAVLVAGVESKSQIPHGSKLYRAAAGA
jgi:hypothetical protein